MKFLLIAIIITHGLLHLIGASGALQIALSFKLTEPRLQSLWLLAFLLFLITTLLFALDKDFWWVVALISVFLSQYLIIQEWQNAKYGTALNMIILILIVVGAGSWRFQQQYVSELRSEIKNTNTEHVEILTEQDLRFLPEPVRRYIKYSGAVGKPKVVNFKVEFSGRLSSYGSGKWMPFTSEQYNFIRSSKRLFFMKARMKGLPVTGFHFYNNGKAFMDIRLLSLLPIQYQAGREMNIAETVTFFNDMCCFAPGALIDKRITWKEEDKHSVVAAFTNNNISITGLLKFNDAGQLTDFISNNRYAWKAKDQMVRIPWSSPLSDYNYAQGRSIAHSARAIYHYPEAPFCYGQFKLERITFNSK